MTFNSFAFLIFFPVTYLLYYFAKGKYRLWILFIASSFFYAWFIPKYLLILYLTIAIDYFAGIKIEQTNDARKRKINLIVAIANTCLILFIFKYENFFIDNINTIFGTQWHAWRLILPIGLSFHTFQNLSYVIDVYRKKIKAEHNPLIYGNYVMMFPQLVAGPIERAGNLIPQLHTSTTYKLQLPDFIIGSSSFFFGLFKKVVVADNIAPYVDAVYKYHTLHTGTTLIVATLLFTLQIYADFSGYSDMARGTARMLGFKFLPNFETPFFARNVTDFWRRWHISLSSWLRDYLYYPIIFAFGKITKTKMASAVLITFALIGLWHGAAWTFVIFGLIHGVYLVVELYLDPLRKKLDTSRVMSHGFVRIPYRLLEVVVLYILVSYAFVFFRSNSLTQAFTITKKMYTEVGGTALNVLDTNTFGILLFASIIFIGTEWLVFRKHSFDTLFNTTKGKIILSGITIGSILLLLSFGAFGSASFIYFQF